MTISTSAWANIGGHSTHYGKVSVAKTGQGKVYAGNSQSAIGGSTELEWNCAGTSGDDTQTFYLFAIPEDGWKFKGWSGSGTSTDNPFKVEPKTTSTNQNNPTTFNYTATFEQLKSFYAKGVAMSTDAQRGTAQVTSDGVNYQTSATKGKLAGDNSEINAKIAFTFKATTKGDNMFTGWSESENGEIVSTENPYVREVTATATNDASPTTVTLYAHFASADPFHFSATAIAGEHGTASVVMQSNGQATSTVNGMGNAKEKAIFTATPDDGYTLAGWATEPGSTNYESTSNPYECELTNTETGSTVSKTLYAVFEKYVDPNSPVSTSPAAGSTIKEPVTQVTMTFQKPIREASQQFNNFVRITGKTDNSRVQASSYTLSNDKCTITFPLPTAVTKPQDYQVDVFATITFEDGQTASPINYSFTYAENQLAPVSTTPGDGEAHQGYLTSYSLTYDQPITNTPAANGLKIYGLDEYKDPKYGMTKYYSVVATSTAVRLSDDRKTVTYSIDFKHYGREFYAELDRAAFEGDGWKSAPVKNWINTYINPDIELWGNHTQYADGAQVAQLDSIALKYSDCSSTWPISINRAAFDKDGSEQGLAWIQKYKGGNWIDYQIVKINQSTNNNASVKHDVDNTVLLVPCVVDDQGKITERVSVFHPGQYRLIVPENSLFTSPFKKAYPVDQLFNQEMTITFTIPGDESMDYLTPLSTTPADKSKVSNQFAEMNLTFALPITDMPEASTMKVYDKAGNRLLATATNTSLSDDQMTLTYTLDTPITTKDTVLVQIEAGAFGADDWTNEPIKRKVIIQERFGIHAVMAPNQWRAMGFEIEAEKDGHGVLEGNYTEYYGAVPIFKMENGQPVNVKQKDVSAFNIEYDAQKHTCFIPIIQQSWLWGEGDYYFDLPVAFLRYPAEQTGSGEDATVTRWAESEATRIHFSLAPQGPTEFTVSPAEGSTLTKISEFTMTITEATQLYKAGHYGKEISDYLLVSKDGGEPITYIIYDNDRDGDPSSTTAGGVDASVSDKLVISTNSDGDNLNAVTIKIADGFKTPGEDTYGFASSGTYTITVPAGMFEIDGAYYNTDMTFTYTVKNNVVEKRKFEGHFSVTPATTDTIVNLTRDLSEIIVRFKDADKITVSNANAWVKGADTHLTYMTLSQVQPIDDVTFRFLMQRNESVTENQDDHILFTFEATINADGKYYDYADANDYMGDNTVYDVNAYATQWRYMTQEQYDANVITFAPVSGTEVQSLSTISVMPISGYKYILNSKLDKLQLPIQWNGMTLNYYAKGKQDIYNNAGELNIYNTNGDKVTLTQPGTYTISVPDGYFLLQNAGNFSDAHSKPETITYTIAGVPTIGIVVKFISGEWATPVTSEKIVEIVDQILEK